MDERMTAPTPRKLAVVAFGGNALLRPEDHGTQDEHGDVAKLEKLVPQVRNAETVIVTGADHFFTKQLEALEETMHGWAEELLEV